MRKGFRNRAFPLALITISAICASAIQLLTPRLINVAIDDGPRRLEHVPFPFLIQASEPLYHITAQIDRKSYQFSRLTLLPKYCLPMVWINNQPVFLNSLGHCDFVRGYQVRLPVADHLASSQPLQLDARVSSNGYIFGLRVSPPAGHPLVLALKLIATIILVAGLYMAMRRWHISRPVSLILLAALPVQLLYLSHTPVTERSYDTLGHLQHIEFIAYYSSLPSSDYCPECYQPDLYYVLSAAIYSLARTAGIFDPFVVLQYFSLFWFWVFLIMSVRIVLLWLPRQREVLLATALLAFWPGGFFQSARVSNDLPLYAFFATCLYFVLSWWNTGNHRHLFTASIVAACGVLIKALMVIPMATIGILILYRIWHKRGESKPWFSYVPVLLVMAGGIGVYLAQNLMKAGGPLHNWRSLYVGGTWEALSPSMYVGNSWKDYLTLNTAAYFKFPFVDSVSPGTGKEYFWNYVLKSSMFGDYSGWFPKPAQRLIALVMSPLLLVLVVLFGAGVARSVRSSFRQSLPLLVAIFLSFLVLFLHRFFTPYSCNNDFRFIYPALIPIVLFLVKGTRNFAIGRALCIGFCGLSAAVYLTV